MAGRRDHEAQITLPPLEGKGFVLDIGGGGEGVIGRLAPSRVVAIDRLASELEEARKSGCHCLMATMDASNLQFLDQTFDAATAFFSMMYMNPELYARVLSETYRVLKPGGRFTLWDLVIPERSPDEDADTLYVVILTCLLPEETVRTAYGVRWRDRVLNPERICSIAGAAGFETMSSEQHGSTFTVELRKPVVS